MDNNIHSDWLWGTLERVVLKRAIHAFSIEKNRLLSSTVSASKLKRMAVAWSFAGQFRGKMAFFKFLPQKLHHEVKKIKYVFGVKIRKMRFYPPNGKFDGVKWPSPEFQRKIKVFEDDVIKFCWQKQPWNEPYLRL